MTERKRCPWVKLHNPTYVRYHDEEWGVPVHDDQRHFEFLILEGAQAGLSWETVLMKREAYRKHFLDFDPVRVARFTESKIAKILKDPGVIRNRLKIQAAVTNAQCFLAVQKEFGTFDKYIWSFVSGKTIVKRPRQIKDYKATSAESDALSIDLRKRGFKFVGSTVIYSHLQACGLIDEHSVDCFKANRRRG